MDHEQHNLISNDSEGTTSSHDDTDSIYGQFTINESASYHSGSCETVEIDKPDDILQKEPPYIYQQDVVRCNKTGNVGFVSEVAGDLDSESDITDDEDDDEDSKEKVGEEDDKENAVHGEGNTNNSVDEKKNADSFKCGSLLADQVRVVWMDHTEPVQYIKDVTVIDRGFSLGDCVASASDATGQVGVVVNVNITVDLLSPDGSVVKDISTRELKRVRDFAVGDYVVHGSWLGRIDDVADNVTVSFDDGSMCKVVNAEPSRLRPSPRNTLEEDVHFPYYPGQHVKASSSSVFKYSWWLSGSWKPRRLEGTVTKVTAGSIYVYWIASAGSGQGSSVAPSEQQNPKNLKLLTWFAYANWQVGDRCLLPSLTQSSSIPLHKQHSYDLGLHDSTKNEEAHQVERGFDSEDIEESNENSESTELGPEPSLNGKKDTISKRASASPSVSKEPAHNSWPLHRKKIRKVVIRKDKKIRNKEESYDRAVLIVNSKTGVDVLWQDGTVERDRKAITLIPIESPADHEFFSEQYVVERASDDASDATEPKRVGVVKSVDAKERTACVKWLKQISRAEDPREFDKEEIVSVYELEDHPDYDYCYGDVVVRLSPVFVAEQTSPTENFLEESTQQEYTKKDVIKHSGPEKVDFSWVGNITGLKDGNIEVTWADGIVSTADPQAIYVIGRDDDDPVVAIGGDVSDDAASWVTVDDEEDEMDAPEKAEEEHGGENSTEVKSDAANDSGSNGALALPLAAIGAENEDQFKGSLKALEEKNFLDDKLSSVYIGDSENMKMKDGDHPSAEMSTPLESDAAEELCSVRIERSDDHEDDNSGFKSFDISQDPLDHHFLGEDSQTSKGRKWFKKVQQDWQILQNNLPDGIYVRVYEDRMDLVRAAILGAYGTPYQDGLFFFDFHLPPEYPDVPPSTYYHSGGWKINPNLYEEGKVCLSLLNTWTGKGNEVWDRKSSSILQVLVSLQGLVLNSKPYFNEAGYDKQIGTAEGEKNSLAYNENSLLLNCKMMMYLMRKPPKGFEELIKEHFRRHGYYILKACDAYMKGYLIGSLTKDATASYELKANSTSVGFKLMLAKICPKLFSALSDIGAECEEFKHLQQESH